MEDCLLLGDYLSYFHGGVVVSGSIAFNSRRIYGSQWLVCSIIAYAFVKSFPQPDGTQSASPFVRIAIISLGPLVWNAAILLILFLVSLFLGPMLDTCCVKFGAVMASIAHFLAMVGMVGFFEFLVSHVPF